MTTIEYGGHKVEIPENWHEIPLERYDRFHGKNPETFREKVELLADLCGIDMQVLTVLPTEIFNRAVQITAFIFSEPDITPVPYVEVKGVRYVANTDDELTLGEWIDLEEVQKEGVNVLSNVLAIVCRPAGEAYDYRNNTERQKLFAGLPVSNVLGVLGFFLQLKRRLEIITEEFSTLHRIIELFPPNINHLRSLGAGIGWLNPLRVVRFWILRELLNYRLRRFLHSSSISKTKRQRRTHSID